MKKILVILVFTICGSTLNLFAWGKKGHDAVAYIAECNLTPKAKKNIERYLNHSIVYYSSWMDEYRATPEYKHTTVWHTAPVDAEYQYTEEVRQKKGDVICELENAIKVLRNYKAKDDSTVAVNLKYIIHMVGDMHCPVHVKYPDINMKYKITLNGKEYSYHTVWDATIIELSHGWSYTEWQQQLDRCSKKEKDQISKGTPREWFHQSALDCRQIYELATPNSEQGKDFLNAAKPLAESQILKAGYRLAKVLNDLFG